MMFMLIRSLIKSSLTRASSTRAKPVHAAPSGLRARSLKAAMQGRLTGDWKVGGGDINQEIRHNLTTVRARARDQELNASYIRRYLRMVETHVVGPKGFGLQVTGKLTSGKPDSKNNSKIETLIWNWGKKGVCELTGRHSFASLQRLVVRAVARDGESLVRIWDVKPTLKNPIGLVLEVLDATRLDHTLMLDLPNGNRVRMGIEIDQAGRALAYWLLTNLAGESTYQTQAKRHERVPASDLLHIYYEDRAEQLRGLTWMSAGMLKLHQLDAYGDAAITAARVGASKMGFFESDSNGLDTHAIADMESPEGDYYTSAEPGEFGVLPKGWKFNPFNPDYPSNAYDPFTKTNLREAASGLGVSYHGLTGDLREVNFSSIRSGTLEEREQWMMLQDWFIGQLLDPVYDRLLNNIALYGLMGAMDINLVLTRFTEHIWQGRRWAWVDPLKDINTAIAAMGAGLKSPQQVAAEQGADFEDTLDQIAEAQRMAKEKGVVLGFGMTPADTTGGNDATNNTQNN